MNNLEYTDEQIDEIRENLKEIFNAFFNALDIVENSYYKVAEQNIEKSKNEMAKENTKHVILQALVFVGHALLGSYFPISFSDNKTENQTEKYERITRKIKAGRYYDGYMKEKVQLIYNNLDKKNVVVNSYNSMIKSIEEFQSNNLWNNDLFIELMRANGIDCIKDINNIKSETGYDINDAFKCLTAACKKNIKSFSRGIER